MNPQDIAKDAIRLVTTAGLSKDVIDLLEKKVSLLTEEIATLNRKLEVSETENANLKEQIENLQEQLASAKPKENGLDAHEVKFLQILARQPGLHIEQIAGYLGISKVKAEYHRDNLMSAQMIRYHGAIVEIGDETYSLGRTGREYLAQHGHI